jgi:hypothetical protein
MFDSTQKKLLRKIVGHANMRKIYVHASVNELFME